MKLELTAAALLATALASCGGSRFASTPPSRDVAHSAAYAQQGIRVSASRFAQMTNFAPAPGSAVTAESTIHVIDDGSIYVFPSDAVIQRSATGTTVAVGHIVKHLSARARIVGHGSHRHWAEAH